MSKYFSTMDEISKKIDEVIESEKAKKAMIPNHPRYTKERILLDEEIRQLRWFKKKALALWREAKRDPRIEP